jgi:hypothetical protein
LVERPYRAIRELIYGALLEPTMSEYSLFSKMITYTWLKFGRRPTEGAVGLRVGVGLAPVVGVAPELIVGVGPGGPTAVALGVPAAPEAAGLTLGVAEPQAARAIAAATANASKTDQPCPCLGGVRRIRINGNDTLTIE